MLITLEHARSVPCDGRQGYCAHGMRAFAERHGLDWGRFLREGLPEEDFLATGDDMALRLVAFVRQSAEQSEDNA